jgi:hypothetical protein
VFSDRNFFDDLVSLWFKRNAFWNSASVAILYEGMYALFEKFNVDIGLIQIILEIIFVATSIFGIYMLVRDIVNPNPIVTSISSLFYVFNVFYMPLRIYAIPYNAFQALLPFSLFSYRRYITYKESKYLVMFLASIIYFLPIIALNPSLLLLYLIIFVATMAFYLLKSSDFKLKVIYNIKLIFFSTLVSIYWALPYVLYSFSVAPSIARTLPSEVAWSWTSSRSSFLNIFWLNPSWAWRPEYVPYINFYNNPFVMFSSFIPFILSTLSLVALCGATKSDMKLVTFVLLILIFLVKGFHEPLSVLYSVICETIPFYSILFREPQSKFMPVILFLIIFLLSDSLNCLSKVIKKNIRIIVMLSIFTFLFMPSLPLITGEAIDAKTELLPFTSYVKIPQYWFEIGQFFDSLDENYSILVLPNDDFYQIAYTWNYYGADCLPFRAIRKTCLYTPFSLGYQHYEVIDQQLEIIQNSILTKNTQTLFRLLKSLNIRFILVRRDVVWNYSNVPLLRGRSMASPFIIEGRLKEIGFPLEKEIGALAIYVNPLWTPS